MSIAATLAQNVNRYSFDDLPDLAIRHAEMLIASTIASAAAGRDIASARIVRALVQEQGGTPEASVWFDAGAKLPVANACRVNALMSDASASDDSDLRTIVHLGTPLTASTLALAERLGSSGKDVLTAMVLGYEVAGRIGEAVMPAYRDRGFHGCVIAIFGAAVAAGRMLGLDARQMTQAIAIASVSMGGLATAADTSVAREYFAGNAALLGMNAALAAQKGYCIEERILETRKGFFDAYGGEDIESVVRDWGMDWDIVTDMAIKLVPGGHPNHTLAEAAANAAREGNVKPEEVEAIVMAKPIDVKLRVGPLKLPTHAPKDLVEVAHTPAYFVAAAVADKHFSWVHASQAKIADPVIRGLIDKIQVAEVPAHEAVGFRHGSIVTIKTKDGRTYTGKVAAPRGSGPRGIEWSDVDDKYRTLVSAAGIETRKIDRSLAIIHGLRAAANVTTLTDLLR